VSDVPFEPTIPGTVLNGVAINLGPHEPLGKPSSEGRHSSIRQGQPECRRLDESHVIDVNLAAAGDCNWKPRQPKPMARQRTELAGWLLRFARRKR